MQKTLKEIAAIIQGRVVGDGALLVQGVSGIKEASEGDITFLANPKYAAMAKDTKASALVVGRDVLIEGKSVIQVDDPSAAFSIIVAMVKENLTPAFKGVHPTAVIDPTVVLGRDVGIGAHVVIEKDVVVGDGTIICAGAFIGQKSAIGHKCLIYPNVTLREECCLGNNIIVHSGSVIGADGFGYSTVGDVHFKIPQSGHVVVEDDVEIGACVTIDRARFGRTLIGQGTKIDNLVHIAHNVTVGKNCFIIALAGIAGSAVIGNNVIIAGQVGVAGHLHIGDRVVAAAQTGITKDIPAGTKLFGTPAQEYKAYVREAGFIGRLPKYVERITALEEKIKLLEEKLGK